MSFSAEEEFARLAKIFFAADRGMVIAVRFAGRRDERGAIARRQALPHIGHANYLE
jgi:hypothetical protein